MKICSWIRTPLTVTVSWENDGAFHSRCFQGRFSDDDIAAMLKGALAPKPPPAPPEPPPCVPPPPVLVDEDIPLLKLKKVDLLKRLADHGLTDLASEPRYSLIQRLAAIETPQGDSK